MSSQPEKSDDLIAELAKLMATNAKGEPASAGARAQAAADERPTANRSIRIPGMDMPPLRTPIDGPRLGHAAAAAPAAEPVPPSSARPVRSRSLAAAAGRRRCPPVVRIPGMDQPPLQPLAATPPIARAELGRPQARRLRLRRIVPATPAAAAARSSPTPRPRASRSRQRRPRPHDRRRARSRTLRAADRRRARPPTPSPAPMPCAPAPAPRHAAAAPPAQPPKADSVSISISALATTGPQRRRASPGARPDRRSDRRRARTSRAAEAKPSAAPRAEDPRRRSRRSPHV